MSHLIQGSDAWLEMRRTKIGASDAAKILGLAPKSWGSAYDLWLEKTGKVPPKAQSAAMAYGHSKEEEIRSYWEGKCEEPLFPKVVFHVEHDWMMASLDGINPDETVISEFKTCGANVYDLMTLKDEIPPYYYAQVQHQLACVPTAKYVDFVVLHQNQFAHKRVYRDLEFINELIEAEQLFWECVVNDIPPPADDDAYIWVDDEAVVKAANEAAAAKKEMDAAKERYEAAKAILLEFGDDGNFSGPGFKATRNKPKETYDYKKACVDHGLDLRPYRKESIGYYTLKFD